jgi:hypothetical protein
VGLGQPALAAQIGKSLDVVRRAEGDGNVAASSLRLILNALDAAGVEFRPDGTVARIQHTAA